MEDLGSIGLEFGFFSGRSGISQQVQLQSLFLGLHGLGKLILDIQMQGFLLWGQSPQSILGTITLPIHLNSLVLQVQKLQVLSVLHSFILNSILVSEATAMFRMNVPEITAEVLQ